MGRSLHQPLTSLGSQVLFAWAVLVNRRGAVCVPRLWQG